MSHKLNLKMCEDMLKDLENQMDDLDNKKQRLQILYIIKENNVEKN